MKIKYFFLLLSLLSVGASAQTEVNREVVGERTALEQRRAELRMALKVREQEAQGKDPAFQNVSAVRHLSVQERADLRQQLRRQRRETTTDTP